MRTPQHSRTDSPADRRHASTDLAWWCLPRWPRHWTQAVLVGCSVPAALAQDLQQEVAAASPVQSVVISARGESRIGKTVAASEGAVGGTDLTLRPLLRTAELLEAMPGMIAAQHSGGGKANQYFLRGFNLDHGTDFSLLIDEVPMNFRTHGHGQGYLDVGGLIPEVVTRIDYRKGPYRADAGDFALVGMASASTADAFERPFGKLEAGRFGYQRVVAGGSWLMGDTDLLLAAEHKRYDGPWALPERLRHNAIYAKATHETSLGTVRASLSVYHATWRPTEQIPERAIGTRLADEFGSLDPTLHGRTDRAVLSVRLDSDAWRISAYAQRYDWKLLSNFTFFLDDPVLGDQLEQSDRRRTLGGRIERRFKPSATWRLSLGGETRFDDIASVGFYKTVGGQRVAPRGLFSVQELSAAVYSEANWAASDEVELFAGLRADQYRFKSRALDGPDAWSGSVGDALVSPKLGASWKLGGGVALYANAGRGFHSNDARGVTAPTDPAPGLVPGTGSELGARYERNGLILSAALWKMHVGSDLIYVGDSGAVEPAGASNRHGLELSAFWKPRPWLSVDASWTANHARFANAPGADHVPGALESTGELGVAALFGDWNAGLRVRHLGPHALVEDNSVRSGGTTLVNLRAAWTPRQIADGRLELSAELLNATGSRQKDVDYVYASRLAGEPSAGVQGLHSRVVEPRSLRVGARLSF
jgi:outer membrane receptor protein involved in Fe transport